MFADKRIPENPSLPLGSSGRREIAFYHVALEEILAPVELQGWETRVALVLHFQTSSSIAAKTTEFLSPCLPMHLLLQGVYLLHADERP